MLKDIRQLIDVMVHYDQIGGILRMRCDNDFTYYFDFIVWCNSEVYLIFCGCPIHKWNYFVFVLHLEDRPSLILPSQANEIIYA